MNAKPYFISSLKKKLEKAESNLICARGPVLEEEVGVYRRRRQQLPQLLTRSHATTTMVVPHTVHHTQCTTTVPLPHATTTVVVPQYIVFGPGPANALKIFANTTINS